MIASMVVWADLKPDPQILAQRTYAWLSFPRSSPSRRLQPLADLVTAAFPMALNRRIRGRQTGTMRTIFVVVMLALLTIAFGIYSEAVLMGGGAPRAEPDPATLAIAHGLKRG